MAHSDRFADILGAVAGVAFALLLFLTVAAVDPQFGVSDQEVQAWWADSGNRTGLTVSMYTLLAACPLFLLFVSRLSERLRATGVGGWAELVFACGIAATTALGLCAIIRGVIASSVRFQQEPLPGVDTLRFQTDLAYAAWNLVFLFIIVLVAVVSILALTTHVLPRWIAWLGLPVALGGLVLFVSYLAPLAIPLVIIWVLANSVHLWRTPTASPIEVPARQPEVLRT